MDRGRSLVHMLDILRSTCFYLICSSERAKANRTERRGLNPGLVDGKISKPPGSYRRRRPESHT